MPTAEDIFDTFPEFAEAEGKETYLELAEADQADLWGDVRYQFAIAFRAAETMGSLGLGTTSGGATGTSGAVTSKHIGSLSVSYASPSASGVSGSYATQYGALLQRLIDGAVVPMLVSGCDTGCGHDHGWSTSTGFWHHGPWQWPWRLAS